MSSARRFLLRAVGAALAGSLIFGGAAVADAKPAKAPTAKATKKKPGKTATSKPKSAAKKSPGKVAAKKATSKTGAAKKAGKGGGSSHAIFDADYDATPAAKYGAMDKATCLAEAKSRGIGLDEVEEARGVLAPVRLNGPLNGVSWRTELPEKERATSSFEVFDCRLVLALHDFGAILTPHGIHEAYIFSAWRPPGKDWPSGKEATRHPGGLAVDIRLFKKDAASNGTDDLVVIRDWTPARGEASCDASGKTAAKIAPDTDDAREIRAIYCKAAADRLFNSMLGPNYNKAHENHFHLEITPGVKWRMVL